MNLAIITAHAGATCLGEAITSWGGYHNLTIADGERGMLPAYQFGYETASANGFDILAFLHDDLLIHSAGWRDRALAEFEDPKVGLVGFGGGLGHGTRDLYRKPYDYHQLAREDFLSNMTDAETHGKRFTGSCDVAVLDGFALIVRREILEMAGGWPLDTPIGYIAYDYWLSCITRRLGYRIRLVGVPVTHLGGRTFVNLGIGQRPDHWERYLDAHAYIANEFHDVLPYQVPR